MEVPILSLAPAYCLPTGTANVLAAAPKDQKRRALVQNILSLRRTVEESGEGIDSSLVLDYASSLFGIRAVLTEQTQANWLQRLGIGPGHVLTWRLATTVLNSNSLDHEIRCTLSLLCSVMATRAEAIARKGSVEQTRVQCELAAQALCLFAAHYERTLPPGKSRVSAVEARGRARLLQMQAVEKKLRHLVVAKDKEWLGLGLGLVAEYSRLARNELAGIPSMAAIASGLSHAFILYSARHCLEEVLPLTKELPRPGVVLPLAKVENLCALIEFEAEKTTAAFHTLPAIVSTAAQWSADAKATRATSRELRFKHHLVLKAPLNTTAITDLNGKEDTDDEMLTHVFDSTATSVVDLLAPLTFAENELRRRVMTGAVSWLTQCGGIAGLTSVLDGDHGGLPSIQQAALMPEMPRDLSISQQTLLLIGRITERLAWMRSHEDTLLFPNEIEATAALLDDYWAFFSKSFVASPQK